MDVGKVAQVFKHPWGPRRPPDQRGQIFEHPFGMGHNLSEIVHLRRVANQTSSTAFSTSACLGSIANTSCSLPHFHRRSQTPKRLRWTPIRHRFQAKPRGAAISSLKGIIPARIFNPLRHETACRARARHISRTAVNTRLPALMDASTTASYLASTASKATTLLESPTKAGTILCTPSG